MSKKVTTMVLVLACVLSLLTGCRSEEDETPETTTTAQAQMESVTEAPAVWQWEKDYPENQGIDPGALETLHAELDATQVLSMVSVKGGYIVDEYYKDEYDETSVFRLNSCSKSVTSLLIGIAIDEGFIEGTDVLISEYFPQIAESGSERQQQITIWHLLTHTSGIDGSDTEHFQTWIASDNRVDFVLERPVTSEPGTVFNYFTGNSHLLSAILQEATGMSAYEFGQEYLFAPLQMDSVVCDTDPQGISDGGNGFQMNVYDMAKIGQLYLNGGVWEGQRIVSEDWISDSTNLQFKRSSGSADYGYQWWVRTFGTQGYDAFFAQGHGGQYIFIVPELELITVITSNYTGGSSMYWQLMNDMVNACSD